MPLPVVQSIVGHLTSAMTRHYQAHADRKARMQGLSLMHGLTIGSHAENRPDDLLRQNLMEYIQTASHMDILKLSVLIAQQEDTKRSAEPKLLN